jgi:hypothetical protein
MRKALLCRVMGWTWQQYHEQPTFFIDYLAAAITADKAAADKRAGAV